MPSEKVLQQALNDLNNSPVEGCSAEPMPDLYTWRVMMFGPEGTPYETGIFNLRVDFVGDFPGWPPGDYPGRPPLVRFEAPVYHPNVDEKTGVVGMSILRKGWRPSLTMSQVLLKLRALLVEPELDDPMRPDLAAQWQQSRAAYDAKAREFTAKYAI